MEISSLLHKADKIFNVCLDYMQTSIAINYVLHLNIFRDL